MSNKVYLVDGSGYIFRAFYAVAPLSNREGFPTNALFGFVRMLLKLINQAESENIVVVFDAGRETFRTELYKEYKANRIECPEDLRKQMPYFRHLSAALGFQILEKKGFEADDIIATLSRRLEDSSAEVVIVSADKDLMQLVGPNVSIWDTMHDRRFGPEQVKEKFGVPPSKVVEVLGLMGDSSDNIPGLDGVGPKTATQLIEKFGTVDGVIQSAEAIRADSSIRNRKKIADNIETSADLLRLCRRLVEVDSNVPLEIEATDGLSSLSSLSEQGLIQALQRRSIEVEVLNQLVEQFDFGSLIKDLKLGKTSVTPDDSQYVTVYESKFDQFFTKLAAEPIFAFDLETTSLDAQQAQIVGASFCWSAKEAFYLPILHQETPSGEQQVSLEKFIAKLGPVFESSAILKCGQNLKYDISVLSEQGLKVQGVAFDTMIASYLLNPDRGSHNLTVLAQEFLKRGTMEYEDLVGDKPDFSYVDIDKASVYGCQDAHYAWLLMQVLNPMLDSAELGTVFSKIEMPLVPILADMERKGIALNIELLQAMSLDFAAQLAKMEGELFALAGCEFNLNSPKQLAEILFTKLALPTKGIKKTKTGLSTDSGVLEKLSHLHPLPASILKYRTIYKLKSTYVDALAKQVSHKTGRLHSRFNQAVTGTGRLSSSDPNLQNIPIQTEEGRKIRNAFVAIPGSSLISADYSQIELRVLAHLSGDEGLIEAFAQGVDIHTKTAREIMGLSENEQISPELRRMGKTINFGVIYGMGHYRLARELGIPLAVAQGYIENYFNRYPKVKRFFASIEADASSKGFVSTFYGRKRFVAGIDQGDRDQGFLMRAAINAPIQGTAADIMKLAMIRVAAKIKETGWPFSMLLQIHDELVFECEDVALEKCVKLIKDEMEQVAQFLVPLEVQIGVGKNWELAHA